MIGSIDAIALEHDGRTSWVAEYRRCGCKWCWGAGGRLWKALECDAHRLEREADWQDFKRNRWKPWNWW